MDIIQVKDLDFSYGRAHVLSNINMTVGQGQMVAVVGSNGSGKSTLMKVILGDLVPDSGQVIIEGKEVQKDMAFEGLAYVSQLGLGDNSSFPANCYEVVSTGIYRGLGSKLTKEDKTRIGEALVLVGMEDHQKANIGQISGGQRQRVLLARALVSNPRILMLDEPTTGLDAKACQNFYQVLDDLRVKEGLTVLVISHDLDRLAPYVSKVYSIKEGKIKDIGLDQVQDHIDLNSYL